MKNFDKIYVLDTNVLLHDSQSIYKFEDNMVVIPMVVLEELDHFKKKMDETGRNSRMVSRCLDEIRMNGNITQGIEVHEGILKVATDGTKVENFVEDIYDNKILGVALKEKLNHPDKKVVLVTKDINLRVKGSVVGLTTEDYKNDKVEFDTIYSGIVVHQVEKEIIDELYANKCVAPEKIHDLPKMYPNQYIVLKNETSQRGIARFDVKRNMLVSLITGKGNIWGIQPRNLEQTIAFDLLLNDDIKLVTLVGHAGTGKTLLSVAAGLYKSLDTQEYKKLIVSRPIIPMGKDLGFLPGSVEEKMNPWMKPIFDNLEFLLKGNDAGGKTDSWKDLVENGMLEVEPLTYIRGRSIPNQIMIIDECQNLSPHEIKTIITRAGEGTKIILTGDCDQIDNPYVDSMSNGLSYVVDKFKEEAIGGHIHLIKGERSELAEIASNIL